MHLSRLFNDTLSYAKSKTVMIFMFRLRDKLELFLLILCMGDTGYDYVTPLNWGEGGKLPTPSYIIAFGQAKEQVYSKEIK